MYSKKGLFFGLVILVMLTLDLGVGFCNEPCMECIASNFQPLVGPEVIISDATLIPATDTLPEHCYIQGVRYYDPFIIRLPTNWNGNYYQAGNGGAAGSVGDVSLGLAFGYAAASGSGGHDNFPPFPLFLWGFPPFDPAAQQKIDDYCFGSVHETRQIAQVIIEAYYCRGPEYAYYNSCSTGGRQGLIEAQRYPEDFDGIMVGAPAHYLTQITTSGVWIEQQMSAPGAFDPAKMPILAEAVMNKCDGIDGLVDGLIDDPRNCTFDAITDLPACPDDMDGPDCFTTAQRQAIYNIYDGPRKSDGTLTTPGEPFGSEAMVPGPYGLSSGWNLWLIAPPGFPASLGTMLGGGFVQWIGLPPSGGGGLTWDLMGFNFDTDFDTVVNNMSDRCDAMDPDISAFKALGGKLIHWDGWADPATGPYQTVDYYETVLNMMGDEETNEFYKLYMIPGMAHCGGGLGCYDLGALFQALVGWVEYGVEPSSYIGSGITASAEPRTRPMCAYPEVARYLGEGSIDDAENFMCVEIIPAKVNVLPTKLNLDSKGYFTAFMTIPKGYDIKGWDKIAVVAQGAPAKRVKVYNFKFHWKHQKLIAHFKRQDLVNLTANGKTTFTVTAIFERKGRQMTFEGSDLVFLK